MAQILKMGKIENLARALELAHDCFENAEEILDLCKQIDDKHKNLIIIGFKNYDRSAIMHGILGALSHYEAERDKEERDKRLATLRHTA